MQNNYNDYVNKLVNKNFGLKINGAKTIVLVFFKKLIKTFYELAGLELKQFLHIR